MVGISAKLLRICLCVGPLLLLAVEPAHAEEAEVAGVKKFEVKWPHRRLWIGAEKVEGIRIRALDDGGNLVKAYTGTVGIQGLTLTSSLAMSKGSVDLPITKIERATITVSDGTLSSDAEVPTLSGWWALLPALLAIALAIITREVLLSLFGGVWLGAALIHQGFWAAFPRSLDIVVNVTADPDKMKIIIFTMLMGGLVGLISSNGGTGGIVAVIARFARTPRSGSIATWCMGMLVFFDDYASSLLIGTTMRPITDKLRISREKLSYLVDSTAAPIASLALISTWIGYEVSVLGDALKGAGIDRDPYEVFISGIPSRFYQIFALIFVLIIAWFGRDFGPMLKAERRARHEGKLIRDGGAPLMDAGLVDEADRLHKAKPRWWLAAVPLVVLVGTVLVVLAVTGLAAGADEPAKYAAARELGLVRTLGFILSNAASYDALVYAGGFSAGVGFVLSVGTGSLSIKGTIDAFVRGLRAMTLAIVVLVLAWSIGRVMTDLHAGTFAANLIGEQLPAWSIATITFFLASLMAFATGTSWGTMAILFPIVIPVVALHTGSPNFESILLGSSSAILAGAVFGDHCSPISDTTVLSSIASASDHVDHTRTQAPYAILCGLVAVVLGYIPLGFGISPWPLIVVGIIVLILVARFLGKRPEEP